MYLKKKGNYDRKILKVVGKESLFPMTYLQWNKQKDNGEFLIQKKLFFNSFYSFKSENNSK